MPTFKITKLHFCMSKEGNLLDIFCHPLRSNFFLYKVQFCNKAYDIIIMFSLYFLVLTSFQLLMLQNNILELFMLKITRLHLSICIRMFAQYTLSSTYLTTLSSTKLYFVIHKRWCRVLSTFCRPFLVLSSFRLLLLQNCILKFSSCVLHYHRCRF